MRIGIVGLGAVGGYLAAKLSSAGQPVVALCRGATLAALRRDGLRLDEAGVQRQVALEASDDARALGEQELVIVAVKAQALAAAALDLQPLLGVRTVVLTAMNGVPWWLLSARAGAPDEAPLASVDPGGRIARALPLDRVLGAVVHLSASLDAPGRVRHGFGRRLIVGEPRGGASQRVEQVVTLLRAAGLEAEASDDVRTAIWFKLWGNMTTNPISALTQASADRIVADPRLRRLSLAAMAEAAAIGERIGCPIAQSGEARLEVTKQLGAFRTSMLQDLQAGRRLELDALVGAVSEIGARVGVPTPWTDALLGLASLLDRSRAEAAQS
ncbi:MAG TPA: 2-dehydropantoate 2-reductase [Methylibium sp.]|uniref:2-dehydropantoate 2-reductase n=1 Tax=Methylibium sp. TaxID=2067992 RepID=UPI002DBA58EB|nr:2-dehydropantoate 2-reductase [Methylibium sp.]HEU4459003.1 2-dehydropantoate 2-reductase [Methylibium sp.]